MIYTVDYVFGVFGIIVSINKFQQLKSRKKLSIDAVYVQNSYDWLKMQRIITTLRK